MLDLLKVLKDVSSYEITNKLHQIRGNDDNHKCHLFLEDYFKRKDAFISPDIYNCEAQCITNIFPQYSVEYVQSMLETLGSEDNRVVIVLRQLLKSEQISNNRPISNELKYVENNVLPECLDTLPQASSSNDLLKYLKTTDDGKYQLSNTYKRKSDTNAESAKTKIKSLTSLHNSTFFEGNVIKTCTHNLRGMLVRKSGKFFFYRTQYKLLLSIGTLFQMFFFYPRRL